MEKLNLQAALEQVEKSGTLCSKGKEEVRGILTAFAGEGVEPMYTSLGNMLSGKIYIGHATFSKEILYCMLDGKLYLISSSSQINIVSESINNLAKAIKVRQLTYFKGKLKW